jgi:hypothetical protein
MIEKPEDAITGICLSGSDVQVPDKKTRMAIRCFEWVNLVSVL